ncbi:DUF2232 domain-containing protein [Paenibacillus sp. GD4]|uniref:DUF2232 domain-containing protein n=1 Tax=Paenibacillus sp. GD4 TaxID=3068890 RepID=UPI002796CFDC|nr:DUF2232 domain-containing protein [Paenibacillus sp. GD4]MDQ1911161.1 DUF2232 domain-containing protein [Paenibacillus sp. GD4]
METQKSRMLTWSIVYILILLSMFFLPVINMVTSALVMVPVLVMYTKLPAKRFALHYAISLAVVYLVVSSISAGWVGALILSIALFFLPPVIQMGNLYKKRASARSVITAGTVTLLGELLLGLVVSQLFGLNPLGKMKQFMLGSLNSLPAQLQELIPMDKDILVQLMTQMLPVYMIGFGLFYAVVTHWLARKALVRSGESISKYKPIREWMLPKSFVWFYLISLIMEMFVRDTHSVFFTLLLNLMPLLTFAFAVQGIAFLFYVAYSKGWNRALPIIGIISLFVFPPAYFVISLLGVFDVAFPIRDRLAARK